jgi:hypothetical protein
MWLLSSLKMDSPNINCRSDVNSDLEFLHFVVLGDVADVPEVHAASYTFRP